MARPSLSALFVASAFLRVRVCFSALLVAALMSGWGAVAEAEQGNLLAGKRPVHSEGVTHADRLTDGIVSNEGD